MIKLIKLIIYIWTLLIFPLFVYPFCVPPWAYCRRLRWRTFSLLHEWFTISLYLILTSNLIFLLYFQFVWLKLWAHVCCFGGLITHRIDWCCFRSLLWHIPLPGECEADRWRCAIRDIARIPHSPRFSIFCSHSFLSSTTFFFTFFICFFHVCPARALRRAIWLVSWFRVSWSVVQLDRPHFTSLHLTIGRDKTIFQPLKPV